MKKTTLTLLASIVTGACGLLHGQQPLFRPELIQESDITVKVEKVGEMPFVLGPGFFGPAPNIASPVPVRNKLYLIDQNDAIYRLNRKNKLRKIFGVEEAPDGLILDNRHSILNVSAGRRKNRLFVMFTSANLPDKDIPVYGLPDPLPDVCCDLENPIPVADIYRIGSTGTGVETRTEFQVLYEYRVKGLKLRRPRAIAAFESQSGPTQHNGGGMLTMPDGRVLFATGDGLPSGAEGRAAAQDDAEIVGKLLLINPRDGSVEVAAKGFRNVQRLDYAFSYYDYYPFVGFGDIGGVTAEEINYVSLYDLLDTSTIENFGWGRNPDGLAREGTFYVGPGVPLVGDTEPPAQGVAPSPEPGYIQPQAQYGRNDPNGGDPNGGAAVSGPVTSYVSFDRISSAFTDLASGILYATTADLTGNAETVFRINLIDGNGQPLDTFRDLIGRRADPRLFRFPDGSAGVLLERSGEFFRLTEVSDY